MKKILCSSRKMVKEVLIHQISEYQIKLVQFTVNWLENSESEVR